MRTIAHISDLHFGREVPAVVEALLEDLQAVMPSVVAVSGDLTQRAREEEFAAAGAFLRRLPAPSVVVPGNHDVPLYDLVERFVSPLDAYRRHITPDLAPLHADAEIAILGLSTARSFTFKGGRVSHDQMDLIRTRLGALPATTFKVLVTHHTFVPPPGDPDGELVGRARLALRTVEECGVSLLLAGHLHMAWSTDVRHHHAQVRRSILVAQAGTAVSSRYRGEPNAWNRITVEPDEVAIEVRHYDGKAFVAGRTERYRKTADRWEPAL
jgi:3',5'-cyclic AMP phosphodiesterase CpdA